MQTLDDGQQDLAAAVETEVGELNTLIRGRIKEARVERAMSQEQLGTYLGKGRVAVSDLERGRVQAGAADLVIMARALGKPITFFYPSQSAGPDDSSLSAQEEEIIRLLRKGNLSPSAMQLLSAQMELSIRTMEVLRGSAKVEADSQRSLQLTTEIVRLVGSNKDPDEPTSPLLGTDRATKREPGRGSELASM
jgi:transcriptional regulator with XRE-family HTH domain